MPTRYDIAPCPACGCTTAATVASGDDIRDEVEQLWSFHTRRIRGDTPPDLLHDRLAFSQKPPLALVRCDLCTLLYRNPRERADTLLELYRDEAPDPAALRSLFDNQRVSYAAQAARLTRVFGRAGRGLEVGSYVGAFLDAARAHGWDFAGVDVNEDANRFARDNGHRVLTGALEDSPADTTYDVVAFWNCFDQLADPLAAAHAARARLRDGGMIALRVPNGGFYVRWRRRLHSPLRPLARALLAHNNMLAFPYRHGFTTTALTRLLERARFRITVVHGDALVPLADRWTRRWGRAEERVLKQILARLPASRSPWLEVYATAG